MHNCHSEHVWTRLNTSKRVYCNFSYFDFEWSSQLSSCLYLAKTLCEVKNQFNFLCISLYLRIPGGIEPSFFRKPSSRQEGNKLHLECEIEALPRPEIKWYRNDQELAQSEKYQFYRAIQPSNPNIHFVRLTIVVRIYVNLSD